MIQANELRIGNYVQDKNGRFGIVHAISKNSIYLKMQYSSLKLVTKKGYSGVDVQAISLTPEILEKCGAKPMSGEWQYCLRVGALYWYFRFNVNCYSEIGGIYIDSKVSYLHQLQNMYFSFLGTELNIQL